ncbi:GIN domain-containing protein [Flagellimonas meridianipacifica]|uniref:Putative autotransporter adhesin-like protein n=1 Tax=Flagellimonas meridianipacifica TaxID=1080225 RepID=A0A2T0MA41_9FLAO|nr:DUF2807 domain-containing protein [Allomuricauda pacifica]PRX54381.1 putative autotransporter adhesin-like protein [Allomuricauda pacifica]
MKKSNLILLGALVAIVFFTLAFQLTTHHYAKENNRKKTSAIRLSQDRTSVSFKGIKTNAPLRIILEQDSLHKIQVEAPNYLIDSVKTSVLNDTLLIETPKNVRKRDSVVVNIKLKSLHHLKLDGHSLVVSKKVIVGEELHLALRGHSSAQLQLQFEHMFYSNSSDGTVDISGDIKNIEIVNPQKE